MTAGDDGKTDGYSMSTISYALMSTNKGKIDTWFRFLVKDMLSDWVHTPDNKNYEWLKLNVFTRLDLVTKRTEVIVFDAKPKVQERILKVLPKAMVTLVALDDFYFIHALFAEAVVALQEDAVWKIRNSVRRIEETRNTESLISHDLVRHAIHVSETLDLAAQTVNSMIEHHNRLASIPSTTDKTIIINTQQGIHDRLRFFHEVIQGLRLRSISNKERLLNEIQLSFNVVAQNINRAVQSDSSAMKTIALFTVALFPMPFLASVFSMTVFYYNDDSGKWSVSKKFWIYWAIAIPTTLVVAGLLYSYNRRIISVKLKRL